MAKYKSLVVITGAGASYDLTRDTTRADDYLGFPLGNQIPDRIVAHAVQIVDAFNRTHRPTANIPDNTAHSSMILDTVIDRLRTGLYDTVDEFIKAGTDPSEMHMAAFATSYVISMSEHRYIAANHTLRGWIKTAARSWMQSQQQKNKSVRFITYNYDRSIEWALSRASFGNGTGSMAAAVAFPFQHHVAHLHGATTFDHLVAFGGTSFDAARASLHETAASIRLVNAQEHSQNRDPDAYSVQRAKDWLQDADIVAFLGFGFAPSCLRVLGIESRTVPSWTSAKHVITTRHDGRPLEYFASVAHPAIRLPDNSSDGKGMTYSCQNAIDTAVRQLSEN